MADEDFPWDHAIAAAVAPNVVQLRDDGPPAWMDEVPPIEPEAPAKMRDTSPLPLQYFDDIKPQLTGLWLMKRLLPATGVAVLYGHPGSGKTFLALDWAMHISLGWEWQGRKVKQGLVIYLCAEGVSGLRNRVEAFRRHHNVQDAPFALIPVAIDMQAPDADVNRLIAAVREAEGHFGEKAALVVIDTISKTFGAGKENTDDMVTYVANCQRLSNEFEALTMAVHHRPKDAESEDPRGHSSLKGGSETVIIVEAGETKKLRVTKQKDGEDGLEILFRLKVVELGEDEDGEPVTSCVIEATDVDLTPRGETPAAKAQHLPDGATLALNQLDEALEQAGFYPPAEIPDTEINRTRVGKVTRLDDWRDKAFSSAGTFRDSDRDTDYEKVKKAFNRAKDRLQKDKIIRVWGKFVWREWAPPKPVRDVPGHAGTFSGTTEKSGAGHAGTSGVPPKGGNPPVSRSVSRPISAAEPPSWMDEAPPFDPDWHENPILNRKD